MLQRYGELAVRVGAVTREALQRAELWRRQTGTSVEEALLSIGELSPELAEFVRAAARRAELECDACGRRRDLPPSVYDACLCGRHEAQRRRTWSADRCRRLRGSVSHGHPRGAKRGERPAGR